MIHLHAFFPRHDKGRDDNNSWLGFLIQLGKDYELEALNTILSDDYNL